MNERQERGVDRKLDAPVEFATTASAPREAKRVVRPM